MLEGYRVRKKVAGAHFLDLALRIELTKVIIQIAPHSGVIIILKTNRLGPRVANLPNLPRVLKVVLS